MWRELPLKTRLKSLKTERNQKINTVFIKTTAMNTKQGITSKQLGMLHALLTETGQMNNKRDLIYEVTNGRTTSSRELSYQEVKILFTYLKGFIQVDDNDRIKGKIFALAYETGLIYGHTPEDKKMNAAKLNNFLNTRGAVRKALNDMTRAELIKTLNQFAAMAKRNEESKHRKEVNHLLSDLNIEVQTHN